MKKYRHPRCYIKNDLEFRIKTSESLMKYKLSQSINLKGIKYNSLHNFSKEAKEIILLKYDVWFSFLYDLEQYLLVKKQNYNKDFIIEEMKKTAEYVIDNLLQNDELNKDYIKFWGELHNSTVFEYIKNYLNENLDFYHDYDLIVDLFINLLNETIFECIEIDNVFHNKKIIIYVSEFCINTKKYLNVSLINERLKMYKKINNSKDIILYKFTDKKCELEINNDEYNITIIKKGEKNG